MATATNKTAAFGVKLIHKGMSKHLTSRKTDCLSLVYADKPQTLDHLEDNIRRVIADIRPQMLEKVIENWTPRLDYSRGSHMPGIIFKIPGDKMNTSRLAVFRERYGEAGAHIDDQNFRVGRVSGVTA
ncbi:hypothetical protein TNCV_3459151 [Trichonephila clavipes]|nr:hypothetical protein TNCV_3459151 [Trichonephila clavipes]